MKLMIDTDAGVDDAQAIMLSLCDPAVDVLAITTSDRQRPHPPW